MNNSQEAFVADIGSGKVARASKGTDTAVESFERAEIDVDSDAQSIFKDVLGLDRP